MSTATASTTSMTTFVAAFESATILPVTETPTGARALKFSVQHDGLFQLTLLLDAKKFDWETLYQVLDQYGNTNARTGPWDFRLKDSAPLVPAYWVHLDGVKLGLWYAQRVSIPDIEARRFRGRLAFDIQKPGDHELRLEPFNDTARLPWISAVLEHDPEDIIEPLPQSIASVDALPVARWASSDPTSSAFWIEQRKKLQTTHAMYAEALNRAFDWARESSWMLESLPVLVAAHHLGGRSGAIEQAMKIVNTQLAKPAWGREREDVYGHNGDIGGGAAFRIMAWAYHMLGPQMDDALRRRFLDKLEYQGNAMLTQILLMRDYWGGSLLQDHGRQAIFDFGAGALHLWGLIPAAERWVAYALPRLRRALDVAPTDGVIPTSSYNTLYLYLHNVQYYRDALVARTGLDIIDHASLRNIPAYVASMANTKLHAMLSAEAGVTPLIGGQATMATLAAQFQDRDAAWVHQLLVEAPPVKFYHPGQMIGYYVGTLWGFFAFDPARTPAPQAPVNAGNSRSLRYFPDSGIVQFRDDTTGVLLSLRCGPWLGYHAHQFATGPCDRMDMSVGAGHFVVFIDGEPMLCSPDNGYKIQSATRSILLIDGQGQLGDVGYPMSIPSFAHRGEEIEMVRWDEKTSTGLIRLNLTPAYPASAGVALYTRQFLFGTRKKILVRDHVVLDQPRELSWLFQHRSTDGCTLDKLAATIGTEVAAGPKLRLEPALANVDLQARIDRSPVVWSYASASGGKPFHHVRYDVTRKTQAVVQEFVLSW